MNITVDLNAPALTQQSIFVPASPSHVWAVLSDISAWPTWQPEIKQTQLNGLVQAGTDFDWKLGRLALRNRLHTVNPTSELGWDGSSLGMYVVHNWTLGAVPGGTQVTAEESMRGWPAVLLKRPLTAQIAKVNQDWLNRLKSTAEH